MSEKTLTISFTSFCITNLAFDSVFEACLNSDFDLPLSPDVIQKLISFCLLNNRFSFNNIFYSQPKGTPMGSALSVLVEEIVMQKLENETVKVFSEKNLFCRCYVDDIFLVVDKSDVDLFFFLSQINCLAIFYLLSN